MDSSLGNWWKARFEIFLARLFWHWGTQQWSRFGMIADDRLVSSIAGSWPLHAWPRIDVKSIWRQSKMAAVRLRRIDYWQWSMSNRWVIEAQKFCGLLITHRWHRLLIGAIDYSSMTHRLLIDYYATHERHFSCFLVRHFFLFVIFLTISEVPVDDVETQSANRKYRWFSIVQFSKLNNLDGATVKVWFILENLSEA